MPNSSSTIAQVTRNGQILQGEKQPIRIGDVLIPDRTSTTTPIGLPTHPLTHSPTHWNTPLFGGESAVAGLYIHVPFCFHKCHYCDFYSIVDSKDRQDSFVGRLLQEMAAGTEYLSGPVESIFIGGGTPTLLSVALWQRLLEAIHRYVPSANEWEWTVEANPETVTPELAEALVAGGVNRISIGCQSFNPIHLKALERWHDPRNVHRGVEVLRAAGITNINLDLIFAIPGQTLDEWMADLDEALSLAPSHVSCYSLMYEPNTPLTQKLRMGQIRRADEDLEAAMYEATIDRLSAAGFEHYEISNWARKCPNEAARDEPRDDRNGSSRAIGEERGGYLSNSQRCRHNMLYWTNANWWALGPSASGHVNGLRWKNVPRLQEYLDHGPLPPITGVERVDEDTRIGEQLMLGLRLIDGMPTPLVEQLLSCGSRASQRAAAIDAHFKNGLVERSNSHLRLTRRGLLLADGILADLL